MSETYTSRESLTVQIAIALLVGFTAAGLVLNGLPNGADLNRIWGNLGNRVLGPMHFRIFLQPFMGAIKAARDGYNDAKLGRKAFAVHLASGPEARKADVKEAMVATSQIILLGLAMDTIYQIVIDGSFYPFEAVLVAILLAFLPYVILRGPFRRIAGWWLGRQTRK